MPDTETEIAAKQAEKLPKSEPWLNGYPEDDKPERDTSSNNLPLNDYTARNELMEFFDIKPSLWSNSSSREAIDAIYAWAKTNAETPDIAGILKTINSVESKLGTRLKTDRLNTLYRFVRIQAQKAAIQQKEASMYV